MPHLDGLAVAANASPLPALVFVTAYDEFAVRAFELGALDYLLKPVSLKRLAATIERVRKSLHTPNPAASSLSPPTFRKRAHHPKPVSFVTTKETSKSSTHDKLVISARAINTQASSSTELSSLQTNLLQPLRHVSKRFILCAFTVPFSSI